MKKIEKPKKLWLALLSFRQPGKWFPKESFFLNNPYKPETSMEVKCHVLYESAMEAFLALHSEFRKRHKYNVGGRVHIYLYSTKPTLLNRGSYHSPESLMEREIFTFDRDLIRRHLIRQSCVFTREANLSIDLGNFNKKPLLDLSYTNHLNKEVYLMTIRQPEVKMTYGSLAKYQCMSVQKALFDFDEFPFLQPVSLNIHDPKVLSKEDDHVTECSLGHA